MISFPLHLIRKYLIHLCLPCLCLRGNLAHGFNTQYGEYIGDDFVEFGENIGLNKKVIIQKLIPEITKERERVKNIYENSFMPQNHIDCVLKSYHKRLNLINVLNEPEL